MKYYINGWQETKSYFLSFGFTPEEIASMIKGNTIKKENNIFWIITE